MLPKTDRRASASEPAAGLIRRQIHYAENKRFLRRLPGFQLERELPTQLLELLGKLHQAEHVGKSRSGG